MNPGNIDLFISLFFSFISQFINLVKWALAPIATLLAGYFGVKYGLKQISIQKKLDYIEKQLKDFYSPLLGYHKEILAMGELRVKISKASDKTWKEKCEGSKHLFLYHKTAIKPYEKIIEYNNKQLTKEILPLYRKMLFLFRENYWLAESETRKWYPDLFNFVELWNRWMAESIPAETMKELNHTEEKLKPFYEELEKRTDVLRSKLSD